MSLVLGLDVGGTKIAVGRVDPESGEVLSEEVIATRPDRASELVLEDCVALAARHMSPEVHAIGIGVCELVDTNGAIRSAHTVDWRDRDVAARFAALGPCVVESDVRAAALAEARYGVARDWSSFLYVVAGTGLSCCLVDDGRPRTGHHGNALLLGPSSLEDTCSGLGLSRLLGVRDLAASFGDPEARPRLRDAGHRVGAALAVLVNALDPQGLVLGGRLGLNDAYHGWIEEAIQTDLHDDAARDLPVLASALGRHGGVLGAALYAHEMVSRSGDEPLLPGRGGPAADGSGGCRG